MGLLRHQETFFLRTYVVNVTRNWNFVAYHEKFWLEHCRKSFGMRKGIVNFLLFVFFCGDFSVYSREYHECFRSIVSKIIQTLEKACREIFDMRIFRTVCLNFESFQMGFGVVFWANMFQLSNFFHFK